jgi:hypothetical protein
MASSVDETLVLVSGSVDNSYLVFAYKETSQTLQRQVESAEVQAVETTTISPKYELYPPGNRLYKIVDWEDLGFQASSSQDTCEDLFEMSGASLLKSGEVPII